MSERRLQEVQIAVQRADADLVEMTGEFVEMSKRIAEQTTVMDRLRTKLNDSS